MEKDHDCLFRGEQKKILKESLVHMMSKTSFWGCGIVLAPTLIIPYNAVIKPNFS